MEKPKILSGYDLVARGTTKLDGALPEVGLKDVEPNGSWLEQKQIQSALESRKNLIQVERIEKSGSISHAEWREALMLAEVTQKVGGYWQFFGHSVGKQLFLNPEEALFLIEVNCLLLKYNDVTVSLQQAYSLLLRGKISHIHYKVYASLSRLGYKVFRHEGCKPTEYEAKLNLASTEKNICEDTQSDTVVMGEDLKQQINASEMDTSCDQEVTEDMNETTGCKSSNGVEILSQNDIESPMVVDSENLNAKENPDDVQSKDNGVIDDEGQNNSSSKTSLEQLNEVIDSEDKIQETTDVTMAEIAKKDDLPEDKIQETTDVTMAEIAKKDDLPLESNSVKENIVTNAKETMKSNNISEDLSTKTPKDDTDADDQSVMPKSKLKILENRTVKPCNSSTLRECFENVPDMFQKHVVTVNVPAEDRIPKNVFLNQTCYVLNVDKIKAKNPRRPSSTEPSTYSLGVEVSGAHVRRVRDSTTLSPPQRNWQQTFYNRIPRFQMPNQNFRQFNFWRPQSMDYPFQFNLFQRPFLPNIHFIPRPHMFRHQYPFANVPRLTNFNYNMNNSRNQERRFNKRKRSGSNCNKHIESIKRLAVRLKELSRLDSSNQSQNVASLQRLIQTFNERYKAKICLTEDYEIVDKSIVETIDLDCDDEPRSKKQKADTQSQKYSANFNKLKELAEQLKELESKGKATSRHRRAFSNVVKKFNKSYKADVIINEKFEMHDRSLISLDSSSESDCVIEEAPVIPSGKKLRNPFNILKRLSKKRNGSSPVASTSNGDKEKLPTPKSKYSETLLKTFNKNWLPNEDDFGRAEVVSGNVTLDYLIDYRKDEFIYEYIKGHNYDFSNWLEVKLSFFTSVAESMKSHASEIVLNSDSDHHASLDNDSDLQPIIGPDDNTDLPSVLKKLSIISTNKDVKGETELRVDFDVYNRDVQNFKKSNRPKPHFRVICLEESAEFPSGLDVATLHAKYTDNVVILFAIVGIGSVSYLQMNPTELPVYVPGNDFDLP